MEKHISPPPKSAKNRHQYNFSARTESDLAFIEAELESETETDAVRDSIALMAWVLHLQRDGAKVAIVRGDNVEAIQLFTARPRLRSIAATESRSQVPSNDAADLQPA